MARERCSRSSTLLPIEASKQSARCPATKAKAKQCQAKSRWLARLVFCQPLPAIASLHQSHLLLPAFGAAFKGNPFSSCALSGFCFCCGCRMSTFDSFFAFSFCFRCLRALFALSWLAFHCAAHFAAMSALALALVLPAKHPSSQP